MWRKIAMWTNFRFPCMTDVKKSKIYPHVKDFQKKSLWPMLRNLKFLHIYNVCDVNVSINVQFMLFCCKISFVAIYAVLSQNQFCRNLSDFLWSKF